MLQPFYPFRESFIERLIKLNKVYLVSQTYKRGSSLYTQDKTCLLLTDYDDIGLAKIHYNALKHDPLRAILDLNKPNHKQKLMELLGPESKYKVFSCLIKSAEELALRVNRQYKHHMRRYIDNKTNWRIGRDTELRPKLTLVFGEIYVVLKWSNRTLQVKFEEIENS
jgi:hypothetical protein